MRADRLLGMLMLLQARGCLTARALAGELEVSERTVYRDVEALAMAGVPVYAERGPGGGICLVDSYRTTLTGLKAEEVRALFLLSIPAPLAELGMAGELRQALRKLAAALPSRFRWDEEQAQQRIHLDWKPWTSRAAEPLPYLQLLQEAVWGGRRVRLRMRSELSPWIEPLDIEVEPYGLVAKAGEWHLVCSRKGSMRVIQVSRVLEARLMDEAFERRTGFDLPAFWEGWCRRQQAERPRYGASVWVKQEIAGELARRYGGGQGDEVGGLEALGGKHVRLELIFESLEDARQALLGYGGAVEVLQPLALRLSLEDLAEQVVAVYRR